MGLVESTDWSALGIVLAIVGGFLLANSIVFRHPRTLVEDHFGGSRQRLGSIREYIFHRVQVHLGFLFLLVGFGVQLYGRLHGPHGGEAALPVAWIGIVLLVVAGLELTGWWLSHMLFRRYVKKYLLVHPPDLERDMDLARELGELFGIPSAGDDTVSAYIARVRVAVGLPAPDRSRRPGPATTPDEVEEGIA